MKKIIAEMLAASLLVSMPAAAFAETPEPTATAVPDSKIEEIRNITDSPAVMQAECTVTKIDGNVVAVKNSDGEEKDVSATAVFDDHGNVKSVSDLSAGDTVTVYTAPTGVYMVIPSGDGSELLTAVTIDVFKNSDTLGDYVNSIDSLAINVSDDTVVVDLEGNAVTDIDGKVLAVAYSAATMSIPAITNPIKVIVLEDASGNTAVVATVQPESTEAVATEQPEESLSQITTDDYILMDGVNFVPLRKLAEELGYEVKWTANDQPIAVGTEQMGVFVTIGKNSYSFAKMAAQELDAAPVLVGDVTYVPVSFFTDILGVDVGFAVN